MNYAYERVSTKKQDVKRQEISLTSYNVDKRYIDKLSGKTTDRPELNKLMLAIKDGDNIFIESISRLGRNVDDLRKLCEYFKNKGATVHFIKEGIVTNGTGYKFLVTVLGAVAEMEREQIVERVREGIEKAKTHGTKSGVAIGRPKRQIPKDFKKYYQRWKDKDVTAVEFAKLINVSRATLYRHIELYEKD